MSSMTLSRLPPAEVRGVLSRHMLADGLDLVFDYERSRGAWFHDAKSGRSLLDFMTFFASQPVGYNHPAMKDPSFLELLHRVAQLKISLPDVYPVELAQFVDGFARHAVPAHLPHLFFVEGGALAVENALKVAFDWKGRRNRRRGLPAERLEVLHFREAFHGRSGYTLSLTNTDPVKTDLFPKFDWPRVSNPKLRFPLTAEVEREVAAAEAQALDEVRRAFAQRPDAIAAVIIEPIQAEGGDNHFRGEFLRALEREARANDSFFLVDEVQTGVGITGRFWAHEHFGLQPDALAFGKKTQCCGCLVGPRVDEEPENAFRVSSRINSTWGGNLTDMVRFGRYLEIIEDERLVDNARVVGAHLLAGLEQVERELGGRISNARGRGLLIAFDLATPEARRQAIQALRTNGLLVLPCGVRSVRFRPPLDLSRQDADAGLEIVRRTLKAL
jgi:L-lysine 6-transaminase